MKFWKGRKDGKDRQGDQAAGGSGTPDGLHALGTASRTASDKAAYNAWARLSYNDAINNAIRSGASADPAFGLWISPRIFGDKRRMGPAALTAIRGTAIDKAAWAQIFALAENGPIRSAEKYTGLVRAYRVYGQPDAHGLSGAAGGTWDGPDLTAECSGPRYGHHSIFDCECGIYGSWDWQAAVEFMSGSVLAACLFWGETVIGTEGLRAKHCRIEHAWSKSAAATETLREWGVPTDTVDEFPDMPPFTRPVR